MIPINQIFESLFTTNVWQIVKMAILVFMGLYVAFAIVIVRQVKLMVSVLNDHMDFPLRLIALVHLAFSVIIFLLSMALL